MARFLFAVWPFAGHYFPLLAVARALRDKGHDCAFYTGHRLRESVEGQELAFYGFEAVDEDHVHDLMMSQRIYTSRRSPRQLQALMRDWLLGTLDDQVEDLRRVMATWPPDVLVCETSMLGPILILSDTEAVPVCVFSTVFASLIPGPDVPPFGLGLPRPVRFGQKMLTGLVRGISVIVSRPFRREVNQIRERYHLPPLSVPVAQYAAQMPLYLIPGTRKLDYDRQDVPDTVHYVGPCLWNPPPTSVENLVWPKAQNEWPLIHVTEGTMHTDDPLILRTAVSALRSLPVRLLLSTGGRDPDTLSLGELAPNIKVLSWVSHQQILPVTDLLITTGGAGTVLTALNHAVPMLIIPTEWDKPENAQRIVSLGVGMRLALRRLRSDTLHQAVTHMLANSAYKTNALAIAAHLRTFDGPDYASDTLIQLANRDNLNASAAAK